MNIREWFGYDGYYDPSREVDKQLDQLLVLYAQTLTAYFGFSHNDFYRATELVELICANEISSQDEMFVQWLQDKALPYLKSLCSKDLYNDRVLIGQFEYEQYNLIEATEYGFAGIELRSVLYDVVSYMPDRIAESVQVQQSKVVEKYTVGKPEGKTVAYVEDNGVSSCADSFV